MIWEMKKIDEVKLNVVSNKIKSDFIIDRLCYNLGYNKDNLLQYIDSDSIQTLLATLLINRGLEDNVDVINNPSSYLINPIKLHNAHKAATVIASYCKNKDALIYVYADYDADGISSGYVMTSAIGDVSKCQSVTVKYPNREEGYGLSMQWCQKLVEEHLDEDINIVTKDILVITVDNGITKIEEVDYLKSYGIEVIITDHHTSKAEVPNCIIVDPYNNTVEQDDTFNHLCGCGVAFKVAQLTQELLGVNKMYKYLVALSIATIADVMPMHTENLAIIQYGLDIMNSKECPIGIATLKSQANIDYVTTTTLGWTLGPMINACGRMGDTELASKLFFTEGEYVDGAVAKIISTNDKRKAITKRAVKELSKVAEDNNSVYIMNTKKYPNGVLGIIAGKAAELFNRPSIIVSPNEKNPNMLHGSGRSAQGVNMFTIMKQLKEENLITEYGGHKEAVGVHFEANKIKAIQDRLNELIIIQELEVGESVEKTLQIDEILTLENLNIVMMALSSLIPTDGRTLANPTFAITDCEVKSFKVYPSGYMELTLKQGNKIIDMSAMGYAETFSNEILPLLDSKEKKIIHIAGSISKHFKTKKYVINIVDMLVA